jgi:prepilin-type N-terminal cleavage/methylation domain-containing protein
MRANLKRAFTLIEILISTMLLSIVLIGLYSVLDTQRRSVGNIKRNLDKSLEHDRAIMVLYHDILQSDGNLTIKKGERDTICIESTTNSLYELDLAKVCWLVLKDKDTLVRVEGNGYRLPLGLEDKVEVDRVLEGTKVFEVSRDKDRVFIFAKQAKKEPYTFLLQGIKAPPKPKPKKRPKKPKGLIRGNKDKNLTKDSNSTPPIDNNKLPPF